MSCFRVGLHQQAEPEVMYQDTDEETKVQAKYHSMTEEQQCKECENRNDQVGDEG
jgi:cytochrome c-type biogenesis protein CcmH/NrfF